MKGLPAQPGFTILELLLSVAIIGVLAAISLPVYLSLQTKNDLDIAAVTTAQSLRRAQLLSRAVDGDTNWGVKIQSGSIVVFKGVSYTARDTAFDETYDEPATISVSGVGEIVFAKLTGLPQTTGTTTLSTDNDTETVTVNAKGMIDF